jgi:tellurite resistance protein
VVGVCCVALAGGIIFGKDIFSYVHSSAKSLRTAVKDSVPLDFELQRARDLLEGIIPEMQANVRVIATEEVEVASLDSEVSRGAQSLAQEHKALAQLANALGVQQASYTFGGRDFTHQQVKDDLERRFDRFKEAESVLESKKRLLESRKTSLQAAMQLLEKTRSQKAVLEDKIVMLEGQYRLVQAASASSQFQVDGTKLAQTEKLIGDIKKRLDVAEHVLAHQATFVSPIDVDVVSEKDLVAQVQQHLGDSAQKGEAPAEKGLASAEGKALPAPEPTAPAMPR